MALVVPDVGECIMLDSIFKTTTPEAQTLRLYSSDTSPAEGDTAATYTQATISGYAAIALTRATWAAATTSAGTSSNSYAQQTFSFTGTGTIVGYYVIRTTATDLMFAERIFSTPGQTFNNLDTLKVTLNFQLA